MIRCPVVFAGTRYSFQLPGLDSDSIKSGFVSALILSSRLRSGKRFDMTKQVRKIRWQAKIWCARLQGVLTTDTFIVVANLQTKTIHRKMKVSLTIDLLGRETPCKRHKSVLSLTVTKTIHNFCFEIGGYSPRNCQE